MKDNKDSLVNGNVPTKSPHTILKMFKEDIETYVNIGKKIESSMKVCATLDLTIFPMEPMFNLNDLSSKSVLYVSLFLSILTLTFTIPQF